jgi:large subunit ribosomal protein L25
LELIELKADIRTSSGNGPARALRREGKIPAVLYGPGKEAILLSVDIKDLGKSLKTSKGGHPLFKLKIQDNQKSNRSAMLRELQTHPVSQKYLHADFYEISMDRKITVSIPIVALGTAKGVEDGGILQLIRREVDVLCLPMEIPEAIEVDVSHLEIGDSIHLNEISLSGDIELADDSDYTVITVVGQKAAAEEKFGEAGEEAETLPESTPEAGGEE